MWCVFLEWAGDQGDFGWGACYKGVVYTECVLEQSEWSLPDVVQEFTVYHKDVTKKTGDKTTN